MIFFPHTPFKLTFQTERVKNLLQYGRVGLSDPFLALQRDSIGGSVVRGGGVNEAELRALEETQLAQLEHLITQQRKAHQRMRHVLREAEKVNGNGSVNLCVFLLMNVYVMSHPSIGVENS